jgi:pimeloyl-ACP methyl ester carboxylesterase
MDRPWVTEAGEGPGVVCLHANASTSGQWKHLAQRLASRHRVLAPDLYGAGRSPDWRWQRPITLADEADLIEPVLARAGAPLALVAHSYGAAVALVAALRNPRRVGALVLYEPSLFAFVDADTPRPNDADGIREAVEDADRLLRAGDREAAAERFIDYWMEPGSWRRMPEGRRAAIAATIPNVRRWGRALFTESTPLAALRGLDVPVLLMIGDRTTASARAVMTRLLGTLPQRELHEFEDVGHMGPVTHPDRVNAVIDRFLARTFAGKVPEEHGQALAA